ncbi:MAG: hypothetical protein NWF07_01645 [Candidatus Bathyarchaeota archaeon]|nr:hypothetical protein [Candidatus Bathyarchaeota archaeon]
MKLKQVIPVIIAIIIIGIAVSILTRPSVPVVEDDDHETETPDSGETTDSGDTTDVNEPVTDEDGCIQILPGISREYEIIQIEGTVNETIRLSSESIFDVTADEYRWTQGFAEMTTLQYMSNHHLTIVNPDNETASVTVTYPGVYRIELEADDTAYEVELKVTKDGRSLETGINYIDLFGTTGGPEFNIYPDDPECFQKALDHALAGPVRVGSDWIGLISGGFYAQVDPPVMQDDDHYLALSDEYFYGAFVEAAHARGMKVMETIQDGPDISFTPEQYEELAQLMQTSEWWDRWFTEYEKFLVKRCTMAERHGVDAVVLKMFAETSFNPDIYPDYATRWVEIIDSVRIVYSGEVGLSFINADDRFTFVDELDFMQITFFGGLYTSRQGAFADVSNPTMEELMAINMEMFEGIEYFWGNTSRIIMVITFDSTDAMFSTEDPALRTATDFNEQVLYYEAFFTTVSEQSWVRGVFTERWDYWDEYRRFGDDYNTQYFDETNVASPRNKPAEDVVALWSEIYHQASP